MNIVIENPSVPLRVLMTNPLRETGWMIAQKTLRGVLFGSRQLIDLILLVFTNEVKEAEALKYTLDLCGMPCNNTITISTDLPKYVEILFYRLTDADIFIFISNFRSLNEMDWMTINDDDPLTFESLYMFMKIAPNLKYEDLLLQTKESDFKRRPIIVADGLVALDILKSFSQLPHDIFFCPSSISSIAKSILGDQLKVKCNQINNFYAWGANEDVFHVNVKAPVYLDEHSHKRKKCQWEHMADLDYRILGIDYTQFNATWLKKEFKEKIKVMLSCHPYRHLYKSAKMTKLLQTAWKTRSMHPKQIIYSNVGVISDGSLGTHKGIPYFLPIIFEKDKFTYKVNDFDKDNYHFQLEMKKINEVALQQHKKLLAFCKMFYKKNVINQEFVAPETVSSLSPSKTILTKLSDDEMMPTAQGGKASPRSSDFDDDDDDDFN